MKPILFCIILVFAVSPIFLFSEGYSRIETSFSPSNFYAGDRVELKINLLVNEGVRIEKPASIAVPWWMEIDPDTMDINRNGDEVEISLFFFSFCPGVSTFPELHLGDVVINDIKLNTLSSVKNGSEFRDKLQPQLLLPGTRVIFAFSVMFFAVFFVLFFSGAKRAKKYVSAFTKKGLVKKAAVHYRKMIYKIENDLKNNSINCRDFYILLLDELRLFLKFRADINFEALTTREIGDHIASLSEKLKNCFDKNFIRIFRNGDYVKFNNSMITKDGMFCDLATAKETADRINLLQEKPNADF